MPADVQGSSQGSGTIPSPSPAPALNGVVATSKAAKLTLKLRADSGYQADAEYRISAEQWSAILVIAEDAPKAEAL